MSVKYYIFGNEAGQPSAGGSDGVPYAASYGIGEPFVGAIAAMGAHIAFGANTKEVTIRNTHDSQFLEYSFDGGITWQILGPYGDIKEAISINSLLLRNAGAAGTTYEVVGILQ
jgi:hypothetical protein